MMTLATVEATTSRTPASSIDKANVNDDDDVT